MKHVCLLFLLVQASHAMALRDPFCRAEGSHVIVYSAHGVIHGTTHQFALLTIDGICYRGKLGDTLAGHEIVGLTEKELVLKDFQGKHIRIPIERKSPST